jgi:hypothetical protein
MRQRLRLSYVYVVRKGRNDAEAHAMTPEAKAERVAEIARLLAYRQRNRIAHSGHTVHRLLDAISSLLGRRVTVGEAISKGQTLK